MYVVILRPPPATHGKAAQIIQHPSLPKPPQSDLCQKLSERNFRRHKNYNRMSIEKTYNIKRCANKEQYQNACAPRRCKHAWRTKGSPPGITHGCNCRFDDASNIMSSANRGLHIAPRPSAVYFHARSICTSLIYSCCVTLGAFLERLWLSGSSCFMQLPLRPLLILSVTIRPT